MARLIDLSHALGNKQPVFPGDPAIHIEPHATIAADQYNVARLTMGSHQGTHMDAPHHFYRDGRTVDRIDLARCYGPAVLVDLAPGTMLRPGTEITVDVLARHAGVFRPGARVVYRTGWGRLFGRPSFWSGFPSLTVDAARWIAARRIALLGMDTPGPSADWLDCHRILLRKGREIAILESLANLHKLPPRFTLMAFPLKLQGVDGSPVRAVAMVRSPAVRYRKRSQTDDRR